MPETQIVFYQGENGEVPVLEWLATLLKTDRKGYAKCVARIKLLSQGKRISNAIDITNILCIVGISFLSGYCKTR